MTMIRAPSSPNNVMVVGDGCEKTCGSGYHLGKSASLNLNDTWQSIPTDGMVDDGRTSKGLGP